MLCPSPFPAGSAQALSIGSAPHRRTGPMIALATAPAVAPDRHIASYTPLPTPGELLDELPLAAEAAHRVAAHRQQVRALLDGRDDRLLAAVGACSIRPPASGVDHARRLAALRDELQDDLLLVMRTYFEKPRTTVGWKGLINDPHLNGSHDIATGLHRARTFLREVAALGLPCATEFLEPIS